MEKDILEGVAMKVVELYQLLLSVSCKLDEFGALDQPKITSILRSADKERFLSAVQKEFYSEEEMDISELSPLSMCNDLHSQNTIEILNQILEQIQSN